MLTKGQSAWIVFGIVVGMIYGGGYAYLTADGVEMKEFDLATPEASDNVRYFYPTDQVIQEHKKSIAFFYTVDDKNYSSMQGEAAWPMKGHPRDSSVITEMMKAGNDGYFRGDFYDEETQTIVSVSGVMNEGEYYFYREDRDLDFMFPAEVESHLAGDKVVATYTPNPVEYTVTFLVVLAALTVLLSPLINGIFSGKKKAPEGALRNPNNQ